MSEEIERMLRQLGSSLHAQTETESNSVVQAHVANARKHALQAFRESQRLSRVERRIVWSLVSRSPFFHGALAFGLLLLVLFVGKNNFQQQNVPQQIARQNVERQIQAPSLLFEEGSELLPAEYGEPVEYVSLSMDYEALNFSLEDLSLEDLNHNIMNEVNYETIM